MSIDISWEQLTSGSEGLELADSVRTFLHYKFQEVQLPGFIRSVEVHSFEFGTEAPAVELKDISDPLPEFYEDDSSDEEEIEEKIDENGNIESQLSPPRAAQSPQDKYKDPRTPEQKPRRPSLSLGRSNTATAAIPSLPSPGIPGGTSNLNNFFLPLTPSLSGTQTPTVFQPPFPGYQRGYSYHGRGPSVDTLAQALARQPEHHRDDPSTRPSTAHSQGGLGGETLIDAALPASLPKDDPASPYSSDFQTTLHISYTGSLSLSLTAEILIDYPMPSFVGIPLKLRITGLSFDGVALIAYLRGKNVLPRSTQKLDAALDEEKTADKEKIKFCFLSREDAQVMIGSEMNMADKSPAPPLEATQASETIDAAHPQQQRAVGGLIQEIRVESEIGRKEDGKQVLKNVGKVERFIVEQMRRIFEDEFVFPSFWTFLV